MTENRHPLAVTAALEKVLDNISKIIDDGDIYDPVIDCLKFCEGHGFLEIWQFVTKYSPSDPWKSHARL